LLQQINLCAFSVSWISEVKSKPFNHLHTI
jgi:hypothetical protein